MVKHLKAFETKYVEISTSKVVFQVFYILSLLKNSTKYRFFRNNLQLLTILFFMFI